MSNEISVSPLVDVLSKQLGKVVVMKGSDYVFLDNKSVVAQSQIDIALATQADEENIQLGIKWKKDRELLVEAIVVTYDSVVYQSNETDRGRMSVAMSSMSDSDTQEWTAKDNSVQVLNRADLMSIIKDGNTQQTLIWNDGRP